MDKVRFGIIGCGTVASYGHIPGICGIDDAELVAVADISQARLDEVRAKHGIEASYTDYRDLLARDDIEAVGIAVPIDMHYQVVMDAAKAGKHVLCEKPIAPTSEQGQEMVKAMADAGKLFAINFEKRNTEPFVTMKRLLDEGKIGQLKVARFVGNWMGGRWASADRYKMLITVGLGPIVDCGVHDFDLARWYTGSEFAEISAAGTYIEDWPNPDHVIATCRMANGVLVVIETGWAYTHNTPAHEANLRTDLIGTDGLLSYVDWQTSIEGHSTMREFSVYSKDECRREAVSSKAKAFDRMYSLLAQSIRKGELIDLPSGHDGERAVTAALEALRQAKGV
jgi:predicted dehydrogenase